jgi:ABC-type polar amino acid transport system ATPase subunit
MTMLCVTHEMGFARQVAYRVVYMEAGRIVEIAPRDTFLSRTTDERTQQFLDELLH